MSQRALRWTVCGLAAALVALTSAPSRGQEKKAPPKGAQLKANPEAERASGVIVKVEPLARAGSEARGGLRLTINTAAVWRDWARDQNAPDANQSPRKAAERGPNSVATKGQPQTKDTRVHVQLGPDGKIDTRFRTLADETSKGASTPAAAARESGGRAGDARTQTAKPVRFSASDLKPGLFIEADFRRAGGDNQASAITVIRPVTANVGTSGAARK